ncbi:MAG: glycerophosphodiester phosphodiesterase family protein, partial [Candidatus Omnitrophica bacterium]|nr:glycerophosphodiester phosphodiesterase family protein [Candidatus Omnitrophota bacterium]
MAPQRLGAVVIILVSSQRKHISRDGGLVSISRFSITPELEFNLETVSEERASRVFVPFRLGPQEAMFISGLPDDIVLGKGSALVAFLDPNQIALAVRAIDPSGKMTLGLVNIDTTKAGAFTEASVKRAIADLLERRGAVGADAPISFDLIPVTNYKGIDTQCSLQHAFGRKLGAQEFIQLKQAGVESSGVQEYETLKRIDTRSQAGYAHDKELFEFWPDWNGTARVKSGLYQIDGKIPGAYRADLENALNDLLQSMKNFREKAPPALSSDILTDSIYLSVTVDPRILREELGRVNINGILSNEHPANCVFLSPEAFSLSAAHKELLLLSLLLERKYLSVARVHSGLYHYYILNRPSLFRLLILLQEERHWSLARFSAVLMRAALARNPLHKLDYILGNTISADLLNFELRSGDIDIRHGSLLVSAGRLIDFVNRNYIVMRAHITGIPPSAVTIVVRDPANSRSAAIILQKTGADTWSLRAAAVERLAARRETGEDGLTVLIPLFAGEQYVEEDSECGDGGKYDLRWGCADFRLRAVKLWRANRKQDARTIAMLIDLLGDEAWGVRNAAKAALIDIGEPAIGALTAARSDLRQRVAEGAAAALKEIITKEARIDHERDNNVRAQEIGSGWKEPTQNGPRKEFKLDGGSRTRSGSPSNKAPARIISRQKLTGSLRNKPLYRVLHSLAGGIATRPALAEATGISESTVKYQINKLISLGLCERRPYQYFIKPGVSAREIIEHQFVREPLYRVFEAISRGNDTGTEVARSTGIPAATVWKQLKCLCSCNVIERTGNHYAVRRSNEHQLLAGRSLLRKPLWMVFNAIAEGNTTRALIISATGINPNTLDEQIRDLIDQGLVLREQPHYRLTMRIAPDTAMGALIDALVKKGEVFVQEDLRQKIVSIRREMPRSNIRAVTRELADHNIAVDRAKISKLFKNDIMATDEEIKTAMLATGSAVRAAAYIKTVFAKTIDRETVAARSRKLAAADPGYNALLTQTAIPGLEDMQNAFDAAQGCIVPACRILRGKGFKALVTDPRWAVIQSSWMEHVWGELNELERTFLGLAVHTAPDIFMAKDIYQKTIPLGKILMQNEHYSLKQLVHTLNEFSPCLIEKVSSPPQGNSYRIEAGFRFFILNKMPENPETSCIVGVNALTQRIRDIISAQGVNGINLDYSQFARDYPHLAAYYDYLKQSKQIEPRWRVWKTFVLDIEPAVGHANGLVHKKYDIRDMLMAVLELRIKAGGLTFDQTEKIDRLIGNLSKGCIPEHLGRPSRPWTLTIKNQLRSLNQQGKLEEEFLKRREFIDAVPLRDGGAGAHSSRTEIFKPVFFKYLLGLHRFVRGERAVYAGSMSDIAGIAYATDCTEYAFIDNTPFSPIAVPWEYGTEDEWLCRYFNKKFRTSYSIDGDAPYIRLALIEELARMGAQDIVVREEQEKVFTVDFSWRHPLRAESAQRTITYYECDISNPLTALKESVSRGFDIYFQKAPLKLSVPRYRFLAEALGYMMPGGFIVCDTDLFGIDSVHERRPAIESHFTQVILPDAMTNGVTYGYSTKGALMWQKNRADGGNEAALTKQELRALWRELFREAQEQYPTKLLEIDGESANTFLVYSDKPGRLAIVSRYYFAGQRKTHLRRTMKSRQQYRRLIRIRVAPVPEDKKDEVLKDLIARYRQRFDKRSIVKSAADRDLIVVHWDDMQFGRKNPRLDKWQFVRSGRGGSFKREDLPLDPKGRLDIKKVLILLKLKKKHILGAREMVDQISRDATLYQWGEVVAKEAWSAELGEYAYYVLRLHKDSWQKAHNEFWHLKRDISRMNVLPEKLLDRKSLPMQGIKLVILQAWFKGFGLEARLKDALDKVKQKNAAGLMLKDSGAKRLTAKQRRRARSLVLEQSALDSFKDGGIYYCGSGQAAVATPSVAGGEQLFTAAGAAYLADGGQIVVVAHRGASALAPGNTLAAFSKAIEIGAQEMELDVQLTKDGHIVVIHDTTLEKLNGDTRCVSDIELDELRRINIPGGEYGPQKIPLLEEVIDLARGKIKLQIEIKQVFAKDADICAKLATLLERKGIIRDVLVTSFNPHYLDLIKKINNDVNTGLLLRKAHYINVLSNARSLGVSTVIFNIIRVNADLVEFFKRAGFIVGAWGIGADQGRMKAAITIGLDRVTTDDPFLFRKYLERRSGDRRWDNRGTDGGEPSAADFEAVLREHAARSCHGAPITITYEQLAVWMRQKGFIVSVTEIKKSKRLVAVFSAHPKLSKLMKVTYRGIEFNQDAIIAALEQEKSLSKALDVLKHAFPNEYKDVTYEGFAVVFVNLHPHLRAIWARIKQENNIDRFGRQIQNREPSTRPAAPKALTIELTGSQMRMLEEIADEDPFFSQNGRQSSGLKMVLNEDDMLALQSLELIVLEADNFAYLTQLGANVLAGTVKVKIAVNNDDP